MLYLPSQAYKPGLDLATIGRVGIHVVYSLHLFLHFFVVW